MSATPDQITHVSDTALMVAACRAIETAIPDGIVHDPFAERLAGARGMAIVQALPGREMLQFGVCMRARFLDDLVTDAIATYGIETVVSVGCGLDSRPWRLELPPELRWIEVDFPAMLDYKVATMSGERPKCRLEHLPADVADHAQRQAVFAAAGSGPAMMITEGLLMYLSADVVGAMATESLALSGIRHWLLDVTSPELDRQMDSNSRQAIDSVRAGNHLNGAQIRDLQTRTGWIPIRHRSYTRDFMEVAAERIRKVMEARGMAISELPPPPPNDLSGAYLMGRG